MDSSLWTALLITAVMILINGILASTEIAMMQLNELKLKAKAEDGDKKAELLLKMKQNPSNFLSTIQIGITLAGLLSGAFAADSLAQPIIALAAGAGIEGTMLSLIGTASKVFITLLMTYFMLVFGELVPKRIAISKPEKVARYFVGIVHGISVIAKPLVLLLSASTNFILKLIGINPHQESETVTEEEILLMMKEGHQQGSIEENEYQFVSNLFEFTDQCVEQAMVHRIEIDSVDVHESLTDVVHLMSETGHHNFPVTDGNIDKIVGVIHSKDILAMYPIINDKEPLPELGTIMKAPFFVPETKKLVDLFNEMKQYHEHMAIVVDEYGGTSGIITLTNILEEIVGDIEISKVGGIKEMNDGTYVADGLLEMKKLLHAIKLESEDDTDIDDWETVSGFLINRLGYIPQTGQKPAIEFSGYRFKVEEMKGPLIRFVRISKILKSKEEQMNH